MKKKSSCQIIFLYFCLAHFFQLNKTFWGPCVGRNVTRHRNKSEPNTAAATANTRAASMKNVSVYNSDPKNSLGCDVKTLRLFCINQVRHLQVTNPPE